VRRQSFWEEVVNSGTHGLGALLSLLGLGGLLAIASRAEGARPLLSALIYGGSLVLLYSASTFYHAARGPRLKPVLKFLDHAAIYLLIAGTYTPFCLVTLWGPWGWTLLGIVWTLAALGILLKVKYIGRFKVGSVVMYVAMGWLAVVALGQVWQALPGVGLWLVVAGGLSYTVGIVFYALGRSVRFMHSVWHLFVLAGSICHYFAVLLYALPDRTYPVP